LRSAVLTAIVASGALALTPALAAAEGPPTGETGTPTDVLETSVTFNGTVTPNGAETVYLFVYGATRYDAHTPVTSAGAGTAPVAVSAHVEGLTPATTYHVRLIAFNRHGFDVGSDVTFATAAPGSTPVPPLPTPTPPAPIVSTAPSSATPPPKLGETVNVTERSGAVKVKVPGVPSYVPLSALTSVPVGSLVDATNGTVSLKTALPNGDTQTGVFHGGVFEVRQPKDAKGLTELKLRGVGPSCQRGGARAAATTKKKKRRRLWGRDNGGMFRTRGGNSVATVRGTAWYVEDLCEGTLTRVSSGSVTVRDLVRHRTVIVRAGHSYLALAKKR
jgi:hypothetical protein